MPPKWLRNKIRKCRMGTMWADLEVMRRVKGSYWCGCAYRDIISTGNKDLMSKCAIWPSSVQFRATPTRKLQGRVRLTHSPEGNRNYEKTISKLVGFWRALASHWWSGKRVTHTGAWEGAPWKSRGIIMLYCHGNQGKIMLHGGIFDTAN